MVNSRAAACWVFFSRRAAWTLVRHPAASRGTGDLRSVSVWRCFLASLTADLHDRHAYVAGMQGDSNHWTMASPTRGPSKNDKTPLSKTIQSSCQSFKSWVHTPPWCRDASRQPSKKRNDDSCGEAAGTWRISIKASPPEHYEREASLIN